MKYLLLGLLALSFCLPSCKKDVAGCPDPKAINYIPGVTVDNGGCIYEEVIDTSTASPVITGTKDGTPYYSDGTWMARWKIDSLEAYWVDTEVEGSHDHLFTCKDIGYIQLYPDSTYLANVRGTLEAGLYTYTDTAGYGAVDLNDCHDYFCYGDYERLGELEFPWRIPNMNSFNYTTTGFGTCTNGKKSNVEVKAIVLMFTYYLSRDTR